jgi:diguanylate cyclase (GGDEF)-like protein
MALHNQLLDMAYRDALTGVGNRKAFEEQLTAEWRIASTTNQPMALFFIDLDHFKEVNDRFGHDAGDALLVCVAERLRSNLRGPDRLFRLGGDEFTLLMPGGNAKTALLLAERLLAALQAPIELVQATIDFVGLSIGIALYPDHASDAEDLLNAADRAMYQAKQERGRACLFVPPTES